MKFQAGYGTETHGISSMHVRNAVEFRKPSTTLLVHVISFCKGFVRKLSELTVGTLLFK